MLNGIASRIVHPSKRILIILTIDHVRTKHPSPISLNRIVVVGQVYSPVRRLILVTFLLENHEIVAIYVSRLLLISFGLLINTVNDSHLKNFLLNRFALFLSDFTLDSHLTEDWCLFSGFSNLLLLSCLKANGVIT